MTIDASRRPSPLSPVWSEAERVAALESYAILDTPAEADFDDIALLAAHALDAPIAVINLIASDRQWFKAQVGLGVREMPLDVSICAQALLQDDFMVVPDTRQDPRFIDNPLVTADNGLRFYAGALLRAPSASCMVCESASRFAIRSTLVVNLSSTSRSSRSMARQRRCQLAWFAPPTTMWPSLVAKAW